MVLTIVRRFTKIIMQNNRCSILCVSSFSFRLMTMFSVSFPDGQPAASSKMNFWKRILVCLVQVWHAACGSVFCFHWWLIVELLESSICFFVLSRAHDLIGTVEIHKYVLIVNTSLTSTTKNTASRKQEHRSVEYSTFLFPVSPFSFPPVENHKHHFFLPNDTNDVK